MNENIRFWDRIAKIYTPLQEHKNKKLYRELIDFSLQYINKSKIVLEIGAGSGQLAEELAIASKHYIATDFSPKMIHELSKRKIMNAEIKEMDASSIDYPDSSFDIIVIANTLHIIEEYDKCLSECYRVLKSGGLILAPSYIYNFQRIKNKQTFLEKLGFKTINKWSQKEYQKLLMAHNFYIIDKKLIPTDSLPNLFLVGKKK